MLTYIRTVFMVFILFSNGLHATTTYSISFQNNGFFNYNHQAGNLIFQESRSYFDKSKNRHRTSSVIYEIDLKNNKVVNVIQPNDHCISYRPKLSPDKNWIASTHRSKKQLYVLNRKTGDCVKKNYNFNLINYAWSADGKWINFFDRGYKYFHRLSPINLSFEHYSHKEHSSFYVWEPQLKTTLYSYKPVKFIRNNSFNYTSDDFDYFYISNNNEWLQYKTNHPLFNKNKGIYFQMSSESGEPDKTKFFDLASNKQLSIAYDYSLNYEKNNIVMLDDDWLYFQGGHGLFNYKTNKFVSFSNKNQKLIPFSVDQGRFAIMYDKKEDSLKVYDLKEMNYIKSFPPFWRVKK